MAVVKRFFVSSYYSISFFLGFFARVLVGKKKTVHPRVFLTHLFYCANNYSLSETSRE